MYAKVRRGSGSDRGRNGYANRDEVSKSLDHVFSRWLSIGPGAFNL
jgi:hypothetical protein